jgi:hypothetical protein
MHDHPACTMHDHPVRNMRNRPVLRKTNIAANGDGYAWIGLEYRHDH